MRPLLDSCVWGGVRQDMRAAGHDVLWAGEWDEDPGDEEILSRAFHDRCILVTLDKDFGELVIVRGQRHSGILRLVNLSARQQAAACIQVLATHDTDLEAGAIITAEPGRLRIRPASPTSS